MRRSVAACGLALLTLASPALSEEDPSPEATAGLAWLGSERFDLVGVMAARVPVVVSGSWSAALDVALVTAIRKPGPDVTFLVEQIDDRVALAARRAFQDGSAVTFGAALRGVQLVDAPGGLSAGVLGAGWESRGDRRAFGPEGWSGRVEAGWVATSRGIDAKATVHGRVRWLRRWGPLLAGFDADADTLFGPDGGTDLLGGVRADVDLGADRRFGLAVRWLRGRNPLGLETDGLMVGFDLAQGNAAPHLRPVPPDVSGQLAGGAGEGRALARLLVRVESPPFASGTYASAVVDANLITAQDANDLFYLYDVGIAHPVGGARVGGWFYHRSNHVLSRDNPTVTSINVIETGIETPNFGRAAPGLSLGRAGGLDGRVRVGWLASSSFGEDARWLERGSARWSSRDLAPDLRVYLALQLERGGVRRSIAAVGLSLPRGWDVRIESRHESQLFSGDRDLVDGVATLYF